MTCKELSERLMKTPDSVFTVRNGPGWADVTGVVPTGEHRNAVTVVVVTHPETLVREYKHRGKALMIVKAVEYTRTVDNYRQVVGLVSPRAVYSGPGSEYLTISAPGGYIHVGQGHWVIKDEQGQIKTLPPAVFDAEYEPVNEGS